MENQPEIIRQLGERLGASLRDRQLSVAAGRVSANTSAVEQYNQLVHDPQVPLGIRYMSLHCVAGQEGFYRDLRSQDMLPTVAEAMGALAPSEVMVAIDQLKAQYPLIYQANPQFIDRFSNRAQAFMHRLPMEQQQQPIAESKDVPLEPVPFDLYPTPPQQPEQKPTVKVKVQVPEEFATSGPVAHGTDTSWLEGNSQFYGSAQTVQPNTPAPITTQFTNPTQVAASSNKGALIIGGSMIAGAMVFSTALVSQNSKQVVVTVPPSVPSASSSLQVSEAPSVAAASQSPARTTSSSRGNGISQGEALQTVQAWLGAKNRMFGPPYDQSLGRSLATGKALADNIQGPSSDGTAESSLEWLRNRGQYWRYGNQEIRGVRSFVSDAEQAVIRVDVYEQRQLYNSSGSMKQNIAKVSSIVYALRRSDGRLKVADVR